MSNLSLLWPNRTGTITQYFGTAGDLYGAKGHTGLDLRTKDQKDIVCADDGKVVVVVSNAKDWFTYNAGSKKWLKTANYGKVSAYGNHVVVDHGGFFTLYGHMSSVMVSVGQEVKQGDTLGTPGNTGASRGQHLHFELRLDKNSSSNAVNPLPYMTFVKEEPAKPVDPNLASEWAKTAQAFVKEHKLSDGNRPFDPLQRQEMWVMLERFFNKFIKPQ